MKKKEQSTNKGTTSPQDFKHKAFDAIIKSIDTEGKAVEVKASVKGYSSPQKITFGGHNAKAYQPDALAYYESRMDIYAVENELTKKALAKSLGKWILFSLEAKKSRGNFYIVTDKRNFDGLVDIINSRQITAEILTVN
jgi:hypothetical protein